MTLPLSPQRAAYIAAQAEAVHRNLRFLEHVVTGPIGLTTDLKSMREAFPIAGALDERDRSAFHDLSPTGRLTREAGLSAQSVVSATLSLIEKLSGEADVAVGAEWQGRAIKILERIAARLGADLRHDTARSMAGLYVIVDPEYTNGRTAVQVASAAVRGGAVAVQYRDKRSDKGELLATSREIAAVCQRSGAVFIVNDDADVAVLSSADGLHCGQKDLPVREARRVLAPHQVIGKSNAPVQEALDAEAEGADYVAVGAMFDTATKLNTRPAGLDTLREVKRSVMVPVIAIGGINASNIASVVEAGADGVCVASAVTKAEDPEAAARLLTGLLTTAAARRK